MKVGRDEFKNCLVIFFGEQIASTSGRRMSRRQLDVAAQHLTTLVGHLGKGVHDDFSYDDARQAYLATWLVIIDVVRYAR